MLSCFATDKLVIFSLNYKLKLIVKSKKSLFWNELREVGSGKLRTLKFEISIAVKFYDASRIIIYICVVITDTSNYP